MPSPLLYDGIIYLLKSNSGILSAFDAKTGKPHYQLQRLDGVPNVFASPVGAKGRVYFPGQEGTTLVIKHGPAYEVLAKNALDDGFNASPALVDGEIYLARVQEPVFDRRSSRALRPPSRRARSCSEPRSAFETGHLPSASLATSANCSFGIPVSPCADDRQLRRR